MINIQTPVITSALTSNHAETLVSTPILTHGIQLNHAETLVRR